MLARESFEGSACVAQQEHIPRRMLKEAGLLTRPTLAVTSPARPKSAETASSPRDAPCPKQGRSSAADPRFTFHTLRFTAPGNDARTLLADCFSILRAPPLRLRPLILQDRAC